MNRRNRIFAITALSLLFCTSALAKGGGVGNSGYALECAGHPLTVVESRLAEKRITESGKSLADPSIFLARLEKIDPSFSAALRAELERLGPSEDWKIASAPETFDHYLTTEEADGCAPKLVARFADGLSERVEPNYSRLSMDDRRVLEWHEALYQLGARQYGHTNPVRVRALLVALLVGASDAELIEVIKIFEHLDLSSIAPQEFETSYVLRDRIERPVNCPVRIIFDRTGFGTQVVEYIGVNTVQRSSRRTIRGILGLPPTSFSLYGCRYIQDPLLQSVLGKSPGQLMREALGTFSQN